MGNMKGESVDQLGSPYTKSEEPQPTAQAATRTSKVKSIIKKLTSFFKKHRAISLGVLAVIAGLVTWQVLYTNSENTWKRATDYFSHAEYEKAAKELNNVGVPSSADRLRVYGQTMLATRQLDKSLEAYKKLYELNKDPSVKLIIGNIYNEQKKYDDAVKVYQEVITANPSNVQAYVNIATVYKMQNKTTEAIKIANEGVAKNPNSVVLSELRVSMLMGDKTSNEYKEAVAALKKLNPQDQLLQALNEL